MRSPASSCPAPPRAAFLALALALVAAAGCEHGPEQTPVRDPSPPANQKQLERTMACMNLAEALYGATYPREVIALASGSPRMDADDESLAPLLDCLDRAVLNEEDRWPEPLVRSLANGYGAALFSSRMPQDERLARLIHLGRQRDIALYWRARIELAPVDVKERTLRLALEENASSQPSTLALALLLVEGGRYREAAALLPVLSEHTRPDLQAYVHAAAALSRGDRHQAAALLDKLLRGQLPRTTPNGPDALALRVEAAPAPSSLLCDVGRAHVAAGERSDAVYAYRVAACFTELTTMHLDEGDAFAGLLTSFWSGPDTYERALEAAGADGLLRERLHALATGCGALLGGERCEHHRARLHDVSLRLEKATAAGASAASQETDEVVRRALGLLVYDDERSLLGAPLVGGDERLLYARVPRPLLRERGGEARVKQLVGMSAELPATAGHPKAPFVDVVDYVSDPRGGRVLVQAVHPPAALANASPERRRALVLVEKTPQGWRAVRFTRAMALSPDGA